jgi:sulfite reductase beta subunit-like hemoprotein
MPVHRRVTTRQSIQFHGVVKGRAQIGDALRAADGTLVTTDDIVGRVIEAKGFDAADVVLRGSIRDQILTLLRSFRRQRTVEQIGLGRGVRWKLIL